jgi:hypothetical protein
MRVWFDAWIAIPALTMLPAEYRNISGNYVHRRAIEGIRS